MTLLGLDLTATRVRAMCGASGAARPVQLDGKERDLPLSISLEKRRPQVGWAGRDICRRLPHLVCQDFLAALGEARQWKAGRHRLDASRAVALVLDKLKPACSGVRGLAVALPAYLRGEQVNLFAGLLAKARLPLLVSVATPLAVAQAVHRQQPWNGLGLVLDADDHALTWTALAREGPASSPQIRVLATQTLPSLGARIWKERLLDGIADRCIRQSRRDLRDSAEAEQTLYHQLDDAMQSCNQGQAVELSIQGAHWYQNLLLPANELLGYCAPLSRRGIQGMHALLEAVQADGPPAVILATPAAGDLPGLLSAIEQHTGAPTAVTLLAPDSVARAAHELAARWQQGALPVEHRDLTLPLPPGAAPLSPPPRTLHQTKLPPRRSKLQPTEDDFSVTIDE